MGAVDGDGVTGEVEVEGVAEAEAGAVEALALV